jgi:hypothetical protein
MTHLRKAASAERMSLPSEPWFDHRLRLATLSFFVALTQPLAHLTTNFGNQLKSMWKLMAAINVDPISKLSMENLEVILLRATDEVTPPLAIGFKTGARSLRWGQDFRSYKSVLVSMLAARLVSHEFHKALWKLFGKVLGDTIFDLHSPKSLETIRIVSSCGSLAPWVTKLTFGFYSCPDRIIDVSTPSRIHVLIAAGEDGRIKAHAIRATEHSMWPGSYVWAKEGIDGSETSNATCSGSAYDRLGSQLRSADAFRFSDLVDESLEPFSNVEMISFSCDSTILPARYKSIYRGCFYRILR